MTRFYTNVWQSKGVIYERSRVIENGNEKRESTVFAPTLFYETSQKSLFKTIYGKKVKPKIFEDGIYAAEEWRKKNADIHGNTNYIAQYIGKNYKGDVQFDLDRIRIFIFDIETDSRDGFASTEKAEAEITAISLYDNFTNKYHVWSVTEPFDTNRDDVIVHCGDNEKEMLLDFVSFWEKNCPDIISGWNIKGYDIPYLVNRLTNELEQKDVLRLSPWNVLRGRTQKSKFGKEYQTFDIAGISVLDYFSLRF